MTTVKVTMPPATTKAISVQIKKAVLRVGKSRRYCTRMDIFVPVIEKTHKVTATKFICLVSASVSGSR